METYTNKLVDTGEVVVLGANVNILPTRRVMLNDMAASKDEQKRGWRVNCAGSGQCDPSFWPCGITCRIYPGGRQ